MKLNKTTAKLLIFLTLLFLVIPGCASLTSTASTTTPAPASTSAAPSTPSPFTEEQLQQLVIQAENATLETTSYKMDMGVTMDMSLNNKEQTALTTMKSSSQVDVTGKQLKTSISMVAVPSSGDNQTLNFVVYMLPDNLYFDVTTPQLGEQWMKTAVTPEILDKFDINVMQDEMKALEKPQSIEFVKYDTVGNTDCIVLKITPNQDYLEEYAKEQMANGNFQIDWDKVKNISDIYKEMSFQVWIARDTNYIMQITTDGIMQFTSDFATMSNGNFKSLDVNVTGTLILYDYNIAVVIVLPDAAKNASPIDPSALSGQ